jgi:hypothetical protein
VGYRDDPASKGRPARHDHTSVHRLQAMDFAIDVDSVLPDTIRDEVLEPVTNEVIDEGAGLRSWPVLEVA